MDALALDAPAEAALEASVDVRPEAAPQDVQPEAASCPVGALCNGVCCPAGQVAGAGSGGGCACRACMDNGPGYAACDQADGRRVCVQLTGCGDLCSSQHCGMCNHGCLSGVCRNGTCI